MDTQSSANGQPNSPNTQRAIQVLAAAVIAAAFLGFFAGTWDNQPAPSIAETVEAKPVSALYTAPTYSTLLGQGPVHTWDRKGGIAVLAKSADPGRGEAGKLDLKARAKVLDARAKLRAYDGAPPTIPHEVDPTGLPCLACHADGYQIANRTAPAMSHEAYASCTQCHAPSITSGPPAIAGLAPSVGANTFKTLDAPLEGERAWPGAPPTVPHTTHMRSDCMSCHGALAETGLKTTHPWRHSCSQCHAPGAALDQRPAMNMGAQGGAQ